MSNSDAYNLGYQIGQAFGFLILAGILLSIYFLVRYLRKKKERKNSDDII